MDNLLPLAMKISAKSIGGISDENINEIKQKVFIENRDSKIKSLLENVEYVEKKLEDDEEYKDAVKPLSSPNTQLFYLDFKYK
jgi:glucose-6-phosphate 1-dehydrogenase